MLIIFTLICYEQNICNSNTNVDISKSKYSKNDNNDQYDEDDHSDDDDTGHDRGCLWKPDLAPSNLRFKHQPLHSAPSFRHSAGVSQSEKKGEGIKRRHWQTKKKVRWKNNIYGGGETVE